MSLSIGVKISDLLILILLSQSDLTKLSKPWNCNLQVCAVNVEEL